SDTASEQILAAVRAAKAAGKPVVVSMGAYAASGGYWISSEASHIVAQPTTLTGSIGVYGGKFVLREALGRFGIDLRGLSVGGGRRIRRRLLAVAAVLARGPARLLGLDGRGLRVLRPARRDRPAAVAGAGARNRPRPGVDRSPGPGAGPGRRAGRLPRGGEPGQGAGRDRRGRRGAPAPLPGRQVPLGGLLRAVRRLG